MHERCCQLLDCSRRNRLNCFDFCHFLCRLHEFGFIHLIFQISSLFHALTFPNPLVFNSFVMLCLRYAHWFLIFIIIVIQIDLHFLIERLSSKHFKNIFHFFLNLNHLFKLDLLFLPIFLISPGYPFYEMVPLNLFPKFIIFKK